MPLPSVSRIQLILEQHHPVAVSQYYEDQKEESLKKAADFRANRIVSSLSPLSQLKLIQGSQNIWATLTD